MPICGRCNKAKGDHDVGIDPIVHPVRDEPKEHLMFFNARIRGKTDLGKMTISTLSLNSHNAKGNLIQVRSEILIRVGKIVDSLLESTEEYVNGSKATTRQKNKIYDKLFALLYESGSKSPYSAIASTTLLNDPDYHKVKTLFKESNLWDKDLSQLEKAAEFCRLDRL